ncbi:MAG: hypothetical protein K1Y02_21690 [Candidatus Hydrogenedentes bacterium]|nr:hypothetical protein [Candidatus Hydrogenedentota bacterium]
MDDSFNILFYLAVGAIFIIGSIVKKIQETRDVNRRREESHEMPLEEMPDELRRLLLGEEPRTARMPRPSEEGVNDEGLDTVPLPPLRPQSAEPRTARPRQGSPAPQRPQAPPMVTPQQRQVQQPTARPPEQRHVNAPPRQPVRQGPPRPVVSQQSSRQTTPPMHKGQPMQRPPQRDAVRTAQRHFVEEEEGPRKAFPIAPPTRPVQQRARRQVALFRDIDEVRRAVIFSEVLGPPKGFE